MLKKKMCEIDGKRYVAPGVFADACDWSTQKMVAACDDGRVLGACKDSSGKWIIPVDAPKPLEYDDIRKVLISVLYLKNRPDWPLDYEDHNGIVAVYTYLQKTGYIEPFDCNSERIPYEVVLTEKGLRAATTGSPVTLNWLKIGSTVIQVAASVLTIAQVIS